MNLNIFYIFLTSSIRIQEADLSADPCKSGSETLGQCEEKKSIFKVEEPAKVENKQNISRQTRILSNKYYQRGRHCVHCKKITHP